VTSRRSTPSKPTNVRSGGLVPSMAGAARARFGEDSPEYRVLARQHEAAQSSRAAAAPQPEPALGPAGARGGRSTSARCAQAARPRRPRMRRCLHAALPVGRFRAQLGSGVSFESGAQDGRRVEEGCRSVKRRPGTQPCLPHGAPRLPAPRGGDLGAGARGPLKGLAALRKL
jgi:hypothetical protein